MFAIWEGLTAIQKLYSAVLAPVCSNHQVTRMELDVALFLANNPQFDTAKDMVNHRKMTKSHVSMAVRSLCRRGYLVRNFAADNKKLEHLALTPAAQLVVKDGQTAQNRFFTLLFQGFTQEEIKAYQTLQRKMFQNIAVHAAQEDEHV